MFLLDDIFLAPLNGLIWLGRQINEIVEKELFDEASIKDQLLDLQLKHEYELEPLSDEEYRTRETELLERLDAIRKAKEEA
jgi:hypothetical protein